MAQQVNLAQIDLNLLVALDALLAEESVTRAGERLSLSQPAMSGSLARLRALLGDELLVRTGRTMTLTPFAESLREPVRDILRQIEQALVARPAFDPKTDSRSFTIYASDYMTMVLVRPLLEALATEAPGVSVYVVPQFESLPAHLVRDGIDLVFTIGEHEAAEQFASQHVLTDRFVCVAWKDHPEVRGALTREQLGELPYLAFRQAGVPSIVDAHLDEIGVQRNVHATVESFALGPFLLRGTRMVTFLQERLCRAIGDAADIAIVDSPLELPPLVETMYWHPRATSDPAHHWLRRRIAALAKGFLMRDMWL
jgi:DNA-binding transcriptional LysR family regulator